MKCPICSDPQAVAGPNEAGRDATYVICKDCGNFGLTGSLVACLSRLLEQRDAVPKISHVIRKAHETGQRLLLFTDTAEAILKNPLPRPREQADFLIHWMAINSPGPGEPLTLDSQHHRAIVGARSHAGFSMLVDHLISSRLLVGTTRTDASGAFVANVALTFAGWDYYESLRLGSATYRKAFMAMMFGDATLDSLLEQVLKPAAKRAGFDLFKLDDRPRAGLIDDRMRVEIRASDFVIADLTHDNLGAYWEAGYAEGLGKPVIYTCERNKFVSTRTHFDTNHHLTIVWDAIAPEDIGQKLTETIRATLPHVATLADV